MPTFHDRTVLQAGLRAVYAMRSRLRRILARAPVERLNLAVPVAEGPA